MDSIDQAQALQLIETEQRIAAARAGNSPVYSGYCLNCDAPVEHPRRWCDADCRDQWETEHA